MSHLRRGKSTMGWESKNPRAAGADSRVVEWRIMFRADRMEEESQGMVGGKKQHGIKREMLSPGASIRLYTSGEK